MRRHQWVLHPPVDIKYSLVEKSVLHHSSSHIRVSDGLSDPSRLLDQCRVRKD